MIGQHGAGIGQPGDLMFTHGVVIPFDETQITHAENRSRCDPGSPSPSLAKGARPPTIAFNIYPASGQGADRATDLSNALSPTALAASTERGTRIVQEVSHGDADQAHTVEALRALRKALGEEAFQQWGLGVVASVRAPEVLRPEVHGAGVRRETDARHDVEHDASPREETRAAGSMRHLWEAASLRCSPSGREPSEQLAGDLKRICRSCHNREHHVRVVCTLCGKPQKGLGLCDKHYQRFKRWGDPRITKRKWRAGASDD